MSEEKHFLFGHSSTLVFYFAAQEMCLPSKSLWKCKGLQRPVEYIVMVLHQQNIVLSPPRPPSVRIVRQLDVVFTSHLSVDGTHR